MKFNRNAYENIKTDITEKLVEAVNKEVARVEAGEVASVQNSYSFCGVVDRKSKVIIGKFGKNEGKEIQKATVFKIFRGDFTVSSLKNNRQPSFSLFLSASEDWFLVEKLAEWETQTKEVFGDFEQELLEAMATEFPSREQKRLVRDWRENLDELLEEV